MFLECDPERTDHFLEKIMRNQTYHHPVQLDRIMGRDRRRSFVCRSVDGRSSVTAMPQLPPKVAGAWEVVGSRQE
jgi:hypothetical protein